MATRETFSDDEWKALQKGITGAGMLVSAGHRDFTDSFGEAAALARELVEQRKEGGSDLMRELATVRGTGFGFFTKPDELEEGTLEAARAAVSALAAKAPEELENYRRLVLAVADAVAQAKGGVRDEESAVIGKLRDALGAAGGAVA